MGRVMFQASGVPAGSTKEIIGRYMVAAKCSSGELSRKMGRATNYVHDLLIRNTVRPKTEAAVFEFMRSNWPPLEPRPRLLQDYGSWSWRKPSGLRACMTCEAKFESEGIHNRMCPTCRRGVSGVGKEFT